MIRDPFLHVSLYVLSVKDAEIFNALSLSVFSDTLCNVVVLPILIPDLFTMDKCYMLSTMTHSPIIYFIKTNWT